MTHTTMTERQMQNYFGKYARFNGGSYFIQFDGELLTDNEPRDLMIQVCKKYRAQLEKNHVAIPRWLMQHTAETIS